MKFRAIESGGTTGDADKAWDRIYADGVRRLEARLADLGLSAAKLDYYPGSSTILCVRMPNRTKEIKVGGIVLPSSDEVKGLTGKASEAPHTTALYVAGGPVAVQEMEQLYGAVPGDYIVFRRFAGDEEATGTVREATEQAAKDMQDGKLSQDQALEAIKTVRDRLFARHSWLKLHSGEVYGSVDAAERFCGDKPTLQIVRKVSDKGVLHVITPV